MNKSVLADLQIASTKMIKQWTTTSDTDVKKAVQQTIVERREEAVRDDRQQQAEDKFHTFSDDGRLTRSPMHVSITITCGT